MRRFLASLALILCSSAFAQTEPPAPKPPTNLATLRALVESMTALRSQLDQQNSKAKSGESEAIKAEAKKEAESIQQRLNQAQDDFESVATGVDDDGDLPPPPGKLDLAAELNDLLGPLMQELKQVTEQPRMIERLRHEVLVNEKRLEISQRAAAKAAELLQAVPKPKGDTPDATLRQALVAAQKKWMGSVSEAQANVEVARLHLSEALTQRKSIWQIISNTAKGFVLTRGLNIVLAVLTFFLGFLGWRSMHGWITRFSPWHRGKGEKPFFARLLDVLYHATALLVGAALSMAVLYTIGDWLLLGLTLIALVALLLAAKNGLPRYYSQARLLLNLGEVREGERVVINGLPWQVRSLNLVTELVNPSLQHGAVRIPIAGMTSLSSRPYEIGEVWFPCQEGDWVQLADGTFGKAVAVTSEFVQVVQLGGAHKTYTTSAFLGQNAVNFTGGFRVTAIVKVHPEHRALATEIIPKELHEGILEGLLSIVEHQQIKSLKVEFRAVIPNALEFDVTADFDGEVAEKLPTLNRALQQYALATCNARGWKLGG